MENWLVCPAITLRLESLRSTFPDLSLANSVRASIQISNGLLFTLVFSRRIAFAFTAALGSRPSSHEHIFTISCGASGNPPARWHRSPAAEPSFYDSRHGWTIRTRNTRLLGETGWQYGLLYPGIATATTRNGSYSPVHFVRSRAHAGELDCLDATPFNRQVLPHASSHALGEDQFRGLYISDGSGRPFSASSAN